MLYCRMVMVRYNANIANTGQITDIAYTHVHMYQTRSTYRVFVMVQN